MKVPVPRLKPMVSLTSFSTMSSRIPPSHNDPNLCPIGRSPRQHNPDSCYYSSYLGLETLLQTQKPATDAHDEVLFITTHQTFEIWFKQVLLEMRTLGAVLSEPIPKLQTACELLQRICRILALLIEQFAILETMTPLGFLKFRSSLGSASGLQSVQFKLIEILMGLTDKQRVFPLTSMLDVFQEKDRNAIELTSKEPSLIEIVDSWLSKFHIDDFWQKYVRAVGDAPHFKPIIDQDGYSVHDHRLTLQSFRAALMIHVLREKYGQEYTILTRLCEIDELMAKWRFCHAAMVQRMIGRKTGTGGSSGVDYLRETSMRHFVFTDLISISKYLAVQDDASFL